MRLDAVAIVPAGGSARRLGGLAAAGKAALGAAGRTFLDRVSTVLAAEVPRVIIVAPPTCRLPAVGPAVEIVRDAVPGAGPLAAVRDGLGHALATGPLPRVAVLCACDVPLVTSGVVRLLLDRAARPGVRWVLPVVGGHPQPLLSALAVDALPEIDRLLTAGRTSLRSLAAVLAAAGPGAVIHPAADELRAVDPALVSFFDVDTPDDLADLARRAARDSPDAS